MKKFLSMILVLTMVVTTLMGAMVIDVNAADPTAPTKTSVTVVPDENSAEGRRVTIQIGSQYVPTGNTNIDAKIGNTLGSIYVQGWDYGNTTLTAAGVSSMVAKGTTTSAHIADVSQISFAGMSGIKTDWKTSTVIDQTYATQKASVKGNYVRLVPTAIDLDKTDVLGGSAFSNVAKTTHLKLTTSNALKLTFYGYTQNVDAKTGSEISIAGSAGGSESGAAKVTLNANKIVSESGIPHKIDLVFTSNGATSPVYTLNVFVDGVSVGYSSATAGKYASTTIMTNLYTLIDKSTSSSHVSIGDTDWFMFYNTATQTAYTLVERSDLEKDLLIKPTYTSDVNTFRTDDYITGVVDYLDDNLKTVLETTDVTDKIVDVYKSNYDNPASMFTGDTSTVKLVSRTTGAEVAVADVTGSMDNYYFKVNGIYIIPNKVADPLPYYKSDKDPFVVTDAQHQTTVTRLYYENYEDNEMDENLPALGGLRSGFLKYTATPRGTFAFSGGNIKYNTNDGYYFIPSPQIKLEEHGNLDKKLTLKFDMYVPEYEAKSSNALKMTLSGHVDPKVTGTNSLSNGVEMQEIYFTTNELATGLSDYVTVDLVGNAWNSVAITFDSTDTATDGKYDVSVYVNGNLQKKYETNADYKENAKERLCSLNFARLYIPQYTSIGVMNDAWYAGNYEITATPNAVGVIDTDTVEDVEIFVDNTNNLIAYNSSDDADYSALITAMSSAGYQPVYTQVVNVGLLNDKYDEVDGKLETESNTDGTKTITGKLVKKWMDSDYTNSYVVADTTNEVSTYTIKNANITKAVDNGNGTASITIKSAFSATSSYIGVASTYEEIIAALAAENPPREGRTLELIGFAVTEEGKLPKVYTLVEAGLTLRSLGYKDGNAVLTYREFNGTAEDFYTVQLIVGAYGENDNLLKAAVDTSKTISGTDPDGEKFVTFTPNFTDDILAETAYYKVFAFENMVGCKPIMASVKINK